MDFLAKIAEEKIQQAIRNGEFDQLDGKGKPLHIEDLSQVPENLRMGYKILKNAGFLPEEMQLQKEIVSLHDLIGSCRDEKEQERLKTQLTEKQLRFRLLMEQRNMPSSGAWNEYEDKIFGKL